MKKRSRFCIERLLSTDSIEPTERTRQSRKARDVSHSRRLWVNGSILNVRFMGGTPAQQAVVREQANWWAQVANITFDFNNAPDAEIRAAFNENEFAWSYIGTDAKRVPLDQPTMNLGYGTGGIAAHEFGHVLGIEHMRQNPAGGMQLNEEAIIRDLSGPPLYWTEEQVRRFILVKCNPDSMSGTYFDPMSIMANFYPAEWTRNGVGIKANTTLSPLDKELIRRMYPFC